MANRDYRSDINGMRALAVIGVVAYHFDLGVLPGGFAGVDVFFVVSGFLMTRIIVGRLEAETFSVLGFYRARARRIVPALVATVLGVMLIGVALLNPLRLSTVAQDSVATLLFFSNFLYLKQGGYFAAAANQNWLLHTWSLSVEWQFYILYPFLLVALRKIGAGRRGAGVVLATLLALSFAAMLAAKFTGGGHLEASFYLLPNRSWEFFAGGLCALAPATRLPTAGRTALHYAGLGLILAAMVLLNRSVAWPSAATLVPVVGTAMVLLADRQGSAWSGLAPIRKTGLWSYSIYLWHWPIAAVLSSQALWSLPARGAGIAASIVAGALCYRFVERQAAPFVPATRKRLALVGAPAFATVLAIAVTAQATGGFEASLYTLQPDMRAKLADYRAAVDDWRFPKSCSALSITATGFTTCTFGDPNARDVLVIGDSFAEQIAPRYAARAFGPHAGLAFVTRSGCSMLPDVDDRRRPDSNCADWLDEAYAYARQRGFKQIVFFAAWLSYNRESLCFTDQPDCGTRLDDDAFDAVLQSGFRRMSRRWKELKGSGKDIVVVDLMPFGRGAQDGNPTVLYQRAVDGHPVETLRLSLADLERDKAANAPRLTAATETAGATLVDPATALCSNGSCPIVERGRTLFKDAYHLRSSVVLQPRFAFLDAYLLAKPQIAEVAR